MFKSAREKKYFLVFLLIICLLFITRFYFETRLKNNGVFILGVFKEKTFSAESGYIYEYSYKFKSKIYSRIFSSIASDQMKKDSLLFFLILPDNPKVCLQYENTIVPNCIRLNDVPFSGWKELPKVTCR